MQFNYILYVQLKQTGTGELRIMMENYIVCEKRANQSRIHVKICQYRCENSKTCQAFQDYLNTGSGDKTLGDGKPPSFPQKHIVPRKAA